MTGGMELNEILNIILGGSLVGALVTIATLHSTVRKAKAEASKSEADAETVRVDNAEHATRILVENIVKPLKEELSATRKDLQSTKREMARLRKAIGGASDCEYRDGCPVLHELRDLPKTDGDDTDGVVRGRHGQRRKPPDGSGGGGYSEIGTDAEDTGA